MKLQREMTDGDGFMDRWKVTHMEDNKEDRKRRSSGEKNKTK